MGSCPEKKLKAFRKEPQSKAPPVRPSRVPNLQGQFRSRLKVDEDAPQVAPPLGMSPHLFRSIFYVRAMYRYLSLAALTSLVYGDGDDEIGDTCIDGHKVVAFYQGTE